MLSIIKIKYNNESVIVYFDNETDAVIPYSLIDTLKLEKGGKISDETAAEIFSESCRYSCRNSALRYLSLRSHFSGEMRKKLQKKGFNNHDIDHTIGCLTDSGYLDDYENAIRYIKNRISRKVVGELYLRRELFSKGVSPDVIESAIKESGGDCVDFNRLKSAAEKKLLSLKNRKNIKSKLTSFLINRGFDSKTISKIIDSLNYENLSD